MPQTGPLICGKTIRPKGFATPPQEKGLLLRGAAKMTCCSMTAKQLPAPCPAAAKRPLAHGSQITKIVAMRQQTGILQCQQHTIQLNGSKTPRHSTKAETRYPFATKGPAALCFAKKGPLLCGSKHTCCTVPTAHSPLQRGVGSDILHFTAALQRDGILQHAALLQGGSAWHHNEGSHYPLPLAAWRHVKGSHRPLCPYSAAAY